MYKQILALALFAALSWSCGDGGGSAYQPTPEHLVPTPTISGPDTMPVEKAERCWSADVPEKTCSLGHAVSLVMFDPPEDYLYNVPPLQRCFLLAPPRYGTLYSVARCSEAVYSDTTIFMIVRLP